MNSPQLLSTIKFEQLKSLIAQCSLEQKIQLAQLLERDTFPSRFERLCQLVCTEELSLEEITAEVETVRQQRYATNTTA